MRLAAAAEADLQDIVDWTVEQFGEAQARLYAEALIDTVAALTTGPRVHGVRHRPDIGAGLHTLHVTRGPYRGRHFIVFRVIEKREESVIEVLRLLHDAMDLPRHAPKTPP